MPKILVCAATGTEAEACYNGISRAHLSENFEILKTGIGHTAGAELRERLTHNPKPKLIISSGFAGSWSENLDTGSWVTAKLILNELGDPIQHLQPVPDAIESVLFSVPEIYEEVPTELVAGVRVYELPLSVDMESFYLAQAAEKNEIPFSVLRYITDSPKHPLPSFVRFFTDVATEKSFAQKGISLLRGARSVVSSPRKTGRFIRSGIRWRSELSHGWEKFAPKLIERVSGV